VGELFRELFGKLNRVESKKHLYKGIKELTLIEINTILVIGSEEMKSMSAIAKELGVTFGTPTVTIDRLIEKGFVTRERDEEDRRQVFIKLSQTGEKVYKSIIELKIKVTQEIFGILTQEERSSLVEILSKLNSSFDDLFTSISRA
jgi:DNA-binding MarR family transcriptional regulator